MLDQQFFYKIVIRDVRGSAERDELVKVIKSLTVSQREEIPDVRSAVVFHDSEGRRVVGLYFDKSGQAGSLDNVAVSFTGGLFSWIQRMFPARLR
jgi:hypothetical protein